MIDERTETVVYNLENIYVSLPLNIVGRSEEKILVFNELMRFLYHHIEKKFKNIFTYEQTIKIVDNVSSFYEVYEVKYEKRLNKAFYRMRPKIKEYRFSINKANEAPKLMDECPFVMEE